jgi:hypothetical protein
MILPRRIWALTLPMRLPRSLGSPAMRDPTPIAWTAPVLPPSLPARALARGKAERPLTGLLGGVCGAICWPAPAPSPTSPKWSAIGMLDEMRDVRPSIS